MEKLIRMSDLMEYGKELRFQSEDAMIDIYERMPCVEERKTGKWRLHKVESEFTDSLFAFYICSECGKEAVSKYDFCPYCGTRMEVDDETD